MTFAFRPARRSEAKPLIGLYAESGAGKTYSALLLARGFVGPQGKIGMIETEAGRGEVYADLIPGGYDVISLRGNFSPAAFGDAISAGEKQSYECLIIDSASHEWSGVGGVLAQAQERQDSGVKGVLAWQKPKMEHQRHFMLRLMQTPIPLVIVCMRAKYPMQQNAKKEWERSTTLEPDQASDILFEMFVHAWIDSDHRLHVTKLTRPDLATVFLDKQPITLDTGKRLAEWAKAGQAIPARSSPTAVEDGAPRPNGSLHLPPDEAALSREGWPDIEVELDDALADAATRGTKALKEEWKHMHPAYQKRLNARLRAIHQPAALAHDTSISS